VAELVERNKRLMVAPVFDLLAVMEADDVDGGPPALQSGGGDTAEGPAMGGRGGRTNDDPITLSDEDTEREIEVREGGPEANEGPFEAGVGHGRSDAAAEKRRDTGAPRTPRNPE